MGGAIVGSGGDGVGGHTNLNVLPPVGASQIHHHLRQQD